MRTNVALKCGYILHQVRPYTVTSNIVDRNISYWFHRNNWHFCRTIWEKPSCEDKLENVGCAGLRSLDTCFCCCSKGSIDWIWFYLKLTPVSIGKLVWNKLFSKRRGGCNQFSRLKNILGLGGGFTVAPGELKRWSGLARRWQAHGDELKGLPTSCI